MGTEVQQQGRPPLSSLLTLALRNLRRNVVRTAFTLGVIAFGVAALVISGGFIADLVIQLGETLIHSQTGHVQIARKGYFEAGTRTPGKYIVDGNQLSQLKRQPHVDQAMARLAFSGLARTGRFSVPIAGEGIEPAPESRLGTSLSIVQGRALSQDDRYAAFIGAGLASAMNLSPGTAISLVAPTIDGAINAIELEVVGIFRSFSREYDERAIKVPLVAAQELLNTNGANVLVLLLHRTAHTGPVVEDLTKVLPAGLEVRTWDWLNDFYWKTVALYERQFGVLWLIVLIMVVLAIAGSVRASALERLGEFGTMRALGNRGGDVLRLVLVESAVLGVLGAAIGLTLGIVAGWAISEIGIPMPPPPNSDLEYTARIRLSPSIAASAAAIGVLASVISSISPAIRVARVPIVEALRQAV